MSLQGFTLRPFPGTGPCFPLEITGSIARRGHTLTLRYELRGKLAAVVLAGPAENPARRQGLWEETCFECFLAPKNLAHYWELNLSPAGHWNIYAFQGYRQGMEEEQTFTSLPFTVKRDVASLLLTLNLNLSGLNPADRALEAAISAVIQGQDGEMTYWALTHLGPHPDFHRRDSFIIEL